MSKHNGRCECLSGWTGDCCLDKVYACHPSCLDADSCVAGSEGGAHECTACADGYYLSDNPSGYCYPCHESCQTCSGPGERACTLCYDGFWLEPMTDADTGDQWDQCNACHPCCSSCTGGTELDCASCPAGSTLNVNYCACDNGLVLDLCSCECAARCNTGIEADANGHCPLSSPGLAVNFDFSLPAELTNTEDPFICADWCHPHMPIPGADGRGGWFDGQKTSLLLNNFYMNGQFTVNIGARVLNNDVSLWSAQVNMMTNNRDNDLEDESKYDNTNNKHIIDFFITKCNGIVLDFGPDRFKSIMEHTYEGGWAQFTVCATKQSIPLAT